MAFSIPIPSTESAAVVVMAYMMGAATPYEYATERIRGLGRAAMARLPYQPPPEDGPVAQRREAQAPDDSGTSQPRNDDGTFAPQDEG